MTKKLLFICFGTVSYDFLERVEEDGVRTADLIHGKVGGEHATVDAEVLDAVPIQVT